MQRSRLSSLVGACLAAMAVAPILGAVALAADPTVTVRGGDTLSGIADRTGVSVSRLVELNRLRDPNLIFPGQALRISASDGTADPAARAAEEPVTHVVQPGESVWGIARHYGVSMAAVIEANGIADPSRIFGGQRLVIPGAAAPAVAPAEPAAAASAPTVTHVVQRGESVWGIARHYGVSMAAVIEANGIADPSRIFGGQRLVIPGAAAPAAPPAASAPRAVPASMAAAVAARDDVRQAIVAESERFNVPTAFVLAVAWQESGWRQEAVSYAGAIGVMQLLPTTADWVSEAMLGSAVDVHSMRDNVRAGVRLLAHYFDRYDGNRDLVLAAYYQGQTAVDQHGVYAVSRPYIASIRALERIFGG